MERIGIGIVTYQRFERFKECFENLLKNGRDVTEIMIVDDCSLKDREKYDAYFKGINFKHITVIVNEKNLGVGPSKNKILKYFYNKNYNYIFTIEDDIDIVSEDVFAEYIDLVNNTGYQYVNFALHGNHNKARQRVMKINNYEVGIYPHIVGAFTLHTRKLIDEIGYYDETYRNAWEHVDYCYIASLKGLTSPFWMFIDVKDSDKYLVEQPGSLEDSSIRPCADWATNISKGAIYFSEKHGVSINEIPHPQ
jgi:GT2 family glycosyltransferase